MAQQRKALGRGLSALLGTPDLETDQLREADIERILPNSHQPRKNFDPESLSGLAQTIKEHGGDIVVRSQPGVGSSFQIQLPMVSSSQVQTKEGRDGTTR